MAIIPSICETRLEWLQPATVGIPSPAHLAMSRVGLVDDVDDLNRVTLAATCDVLPLCRDRDVTLLVRLASEAMHVRVDSPMLERAIFLLLEASSCCAQLVEGTGKVEVVTTRRRDVAELSASAARSAVSRVPMSFDQLLPRARSVVEAFGGTLIVIEQLNQIVFKAKLPLLPPSTGELEQRVALLSEGVRGHAAPDTWTREPPGVNDEWTNNQEPLTARAPRTPAPTQPWTTDRRGLEAARL